MSLKTDSLGQQPNMLIRKWGELIRRSVTNTVFTFTDLTRLERLKKWAKKNLVGLTGVAIMAGSLITTIVIAARGAIKAGAKATGKFAKALAEVSKKLAPFLGAVVSLIGNILLLVAKVLSWNAKNLWVLALFISYLVYQETSKRVKKKYYDLLFSF